MVLLWLILALLCHDNPFSPSGQESRACYAELRLRGLPARASDIASLRKTHEKTAVPAHPAP
ncbi:MAG: hypothetical protein IJB53_08675, partial [Mailhella sp.]|nr:hypothetical protein [Mailhella sp.]